MSAGRRALACFFSPIVKQAVQEHSAAWTVSSLANQGCGSIMMPALRSGLSAGLRHQASAASLPAGGRRVSLMTNLKQLSKFKLSSLVVLTASSGYVMGSGDVIDWRGLLWTSLGTFGAAACANTLNQVYEVANDRLMSRTCNRPLPSGRMNRLQALTFAIAAGAFGLGTLYYQTNGLTTALGAANIVLYAGVYTPLKQISIANTWVGAVVGAIPPLMGWASASGQLDAGAWVLSGALFFWQLPHFLALAWLCKDDYLRGGFRMISGADRTGKRTAAAALRNSIYLLPLGALAYYADVTTQPFAWEAAVLGGMLLLPAARFWQQPSQQAARKLFRASLLYLPLAMVGMAVHRQPHTEQAGVTLGEMQAAFWQQVEGPPQAGLLPLLRSSFEQSAAAVARIFGFSHAVIRCPSTVHSDDGSSRRAFSSRLDDNGRMAGSVEAGASELLQGGGDEAGPAGSEEGLPATAAVVVIKRQAGEQRERRSTWNVPAQRECTPTGAWREGLELSDVRVGS